RNDLVAHDLINISSASAPSEVGVTNLMLAIVEVLDSLVDCGEKSRQVDPAFLGRLLQDGCIRHHLAEGEPTPESGVEQRNRTVGSVHGANDMQVRRHAERPL